MGLYLNRNTSVLKLILVEIEKTVQWESKGIATANALDSKLVSGKEPALYCGSGCQSDTVYSHKAYDVIDWKRPVVSDRERRSKWSTRIE